MDEERKHDIKKTECWHCGSVNDAFADTDTQETDTLPEPGNPALCFYCGALMVVDEDIRPRQPTAQEWVVFTTAPEVLQQMLKLAMYRDLNAEDLLERE